MNSAIRGLRAVCAAGAAVSLHAIAAIPFSLPCVPVCVVCVQRAGCALWPGPWQAGGGIHRSRTCIFVWCFFAVSVSRARV